MAKDLDVSHLADYSYLLDPELQENAGENDLIYLEPEQLHAFHNHPFKIHKDREDYTELVESIHELGELIYPVIVRPDGEGYEILAGHRRVEACIDAGILNIPCILKEVDDETATIIMVHSNHHREYTLPSEKAKAYRMCMDAQKHQGKQGNSSAEKIGTAYNDSKRQVHRYIRLSYLIDSLLEEIDSDNIGISVGENISYLDRQTQQNLYDCIKQYNIYPTLKQSQELKDVVKKNDVPLSVESIAGLLSLGNNNSKTKENTKNSITLKRKELATYFPEEFEIEEIENVVFQLLQKYKDGEIFL